MNVLDFGLGETADMLRQQVAGFAAAEIAPRAAEIDKTNNVPPDLWPKLLTGSVSLNRDRSYGAVP